MASFSEVGVEVIAKGTKKFEKDLANADRSIADFGKNVGSKIAAGAKLAAGALVGVGVAAAAVGVAGIKAAVNFESAFAGVIKTTDGLTDSTGALTAAGAELQQGFRNLAMEVPIAVNELLAIGELGGQLGIARGDLLEFTETIAAMGVATNLTTEEAAVGFAQLANIMGTPTELISNMGSAVVALGNNFATTESDILNFAARIAGAGEIAGLTEAQVFAIGTAMSSVGIAAEAGGTAVQKVLLAMNQAVIEGGEEMEIFAGVAGMSASEFGAAWEEDAGAVFTQFVEGLGLAGDDAISILSELGLEDQRLIRAFLSLSNAGDLLSETMDLSSDAFEANTALTKEAEQRYRTTESQFKIFKNTLNDVAITVGEFLLPFLTDLLEMAKPLIQEFGKQLPEFLNKKLKPALETVTKWLGEKLAEAIRIASDLWIKTFKPALEIIVAFVQKNWPVVQDVIERVMGRIQSAVEITLQAISSFWFDHGEEILQTISEFMGWAQDTIQRVIVIIQDIVETALAAISDFWDTHGEQIMATVSTIWENIKVQISAAIEIVRGIIDAVLALIEGDWSGAWEAIKGVAEAVWESIKSTIETVVEIIKTVISVALDAIALLWDTAWTALGTVIDTIWETIQTTVSTAIEAVRDKIDEVMDFILTTTWQEKWDAISAAAEEIWTTIQDTIGVAVEAVRDKLAEVLENVKEGWIEIWNSIKDLMPVVWDEITETVSTAIDNVATTLSDVWDAIALKVAEVWGTIKSLVQMAVDALPGIILSVKDAMIAAGKAIVDGIKQGISDAWQGLVDWFNDKLSALTDLLPFSEPKDPSSPLHGLKDVGAAIVNNIRIGMENAMPDLLATAQELADAIRGIIEEATKGGGDLIAPTQSELGRMLTGIGRVFGGLGSVAARRLRRQRIDPQKEVVKTIDEELAERRKELKRLQTAEEFIPRRERKISFQQEKILFLTEARAVALAGIAREEERILKLQKAQQDLQFLEQQFKLLDLVEKHGLDLGTILGDAQLGVDADVRKIIDAMTRAMEAIIKQSEDVLGTGSPSKVFMNLGRDVMRGLADGIKSMVSLPEQAVGVATTRMIAAPAVAGPAMTTNNFNLGGNNINTGMDAATFESRVIRIVERAIRQ